MKDGHFFLLDEISLADDSVLERLNSVLETDRTLLLAEKGPIDTHIAASDGFQFLATMNPGGDYGKRELSPALRNRFTEIWVPPLSDVQDVEQVIRAKLNPDACSLSLPMVKFGEWFTITYRCSNRSISVRDMLSWVDFINVNRSEDVTSAVTHGAAMVFIDSIGANWGAMSPVAANSVRKERERCLEELGRCLGRSVSAYYSGPVEFRASNLDVACGPFSLQRTETSSSGFQFAFSSPTARSNCMRIFRALQISKPILLEGSPGVGKTTIIAAISELIGKPLTRINLSEHTDIMDLFGSDVPTEGAVAGSFAWHDGPFLSAMKRGDWILLDEMNLASQSVLEGLNACLDHRSEIYVPELDQVFQCHPEFRVFAAQNPHGQGYGRKGLPASFLSRFTVVFADSYTSEDYKFICKDVFPKCPEERLDKIIAFVNELETAVATQPQFGLSGRPWEFNLRDIMRWIELLCSSEGLLPAGTDRDFVDILITQRFRSQADRDTALKMFYDIFTSSENWRNYFHDLRPESFQVGLGLLRRHDSSQGSCQRGVLPRIEDLPLLESIMICVQQKWPMVLVDSSGEGKTKLIRELAGVTGATVVSFTMNSDVDVADLIGTYEQADNSRKLQKYFKKAAHFIRIKLIESLGAGTDCGAWAGSALLRSMGRFAEFSDQNEYLDLQVSVNECLAGDESGDAVALLQEGSALFRSSHLSGKDSFEWVDGILVHALEQGHWLVLDHANTCNPSVLDRLNSLLEPNGFLAIHERSTQQGEPRIVKPHPNFRIIMTMDPKYGELSRSMRNRAVELFSLPKASQQSLGEDLNGSFGARESAIYRFRHFRLLERDKLEKATWIHLANVTLDHLSQRDLDLLCSFSSQIIEGLFLYGYRDFSCILNAKIDGLLRTQKQWKWKERLNRWFLHDLSPLLRKKTIHDVSIRLT